MSRRGLPPKVGPCHSHGVLVLGQRSLLVNAPCFTLKSSTFMNPKVAQITGGSLKKYEKSLPQ